MANPTSSSSEMEVQNKVIADSDSDSEEEDSCESEDHHQQQPQKPQVQLQHQQNGEEEEDSEGEDLEDKEEDSEGEESEDEKNEKQLQREEQSSKPKQAKRRRSDESVQERAEVSNQAKLNVNVRAKKEFSELYPCLYKALMFNHFEIEYPSLYRERVHRLCPFQLKLMDQQWKNLYIKDAEFKLYKSNVLSSQHTVLLAAAIPR